MSAFEILLAVYMAAWPPVFVLVFWRRFDRLEQRIDELELHLASEFTALRAEIRQGFLAKA